jgi:hypothetical protein
MIPGSFQNIFGVNAGENKLVLVHGIFSGLFEYMSITPEVDYVNNEVNSLLFVHNYE